MGPRPHLSILYVQNSVILHSELLVSMGPRPHLVVVCMQNNVISIRITSLYGSQPSPVVLCMQTNLTLTSE